MLELEGVTKVFSNGLLRRQRRKVLDSVDLSIEKGAFIGLVGESGSGKTTLARVALRLTEPSSGSILLDGRDITTLKKGRLQPLRRSVQIVFQHPETALDPRFKLRESLQEALVKAGTPRSRLSERICESCAAMNLPVELLDRFPTQVSGGEIQRVALTRVLAFEPDYLFLDEPTSMLDVSVQAYILGLIGGIARKRDMGIVLISHDLDVVRATCKEVVVLDGGRLIERGRVGEVLGHPSHERTRALVSAWDSQGMIEP